jgi:hypothetical protein
MINRYLIAVFVAFALMSTASVAGDIDSILQDVDMEKAEIQAQEQSSGGPTIAEYRTLQEKHRLYIISALIVVTPIFLLMLLFFIKGSNENTEHAIIHASGLVLVIQATAIVVIAAPTTEQLTAAIGVLGAIAGYLFGTAKKTTKEPESSPKKPST